MLRPCIYTYSAAGVVAGRTRRFGEVRFVKRKISPWLTALITFYPTHTSRPRRWGKRYAPWKPYTYAARGYCRWRRVVTLDMRIMGSFVRPVLGWSLPRYRGGVR